VNPATDDPAAAICAGRLIDHYRADARGVVAEQTIRYEAVN
jgi:hypothetical protein